MYNKTKTKSSSGIINQSSFKISQGILNIYGEFVVIMPTICPGNIHVAFA